MDEAINSKRRTSAGTDDGDADGANVGLLARGGVLLLVRLARREVGAGVGHRAVARRLEGADELPILQLAGAIVPPAALAVPDILLRRACGAPVVRAACVCATSVW